MDFFKKAEGDLENIGVERNYLEIYYEKNYRNEKHNYHYSINSKNPNQILIFLRRVEMVFMVLKMFSRIRER